MDMQNIAFSAPSPAVRLRERAQQSAIPLYRHDSPNICPSCGKSHWLIGRVMAQCAFCETAMPLAQGWRFEGVSIA